MLLYCSVFLIWIPEAQAYIRLYQTSMMEIFVKIVFLETNGSGIKGLKWILLNQLKRILDELFRILNRHYQPTQLFVRAGFWLLAQPSFPLICAGDSMGRDYHMRFMPRPDILHGLLSEKISETSLTPGVEIREIFFEGT